MQIWLKNNRYSQNDVEKDNNAFLSRCCVIFTILVILSTVNAIFSVVNFAFCLYMIIKFDKNVIIPFFIYATFFASLFKILEFSEMSLFTIVMLIFVIKEMLSVKAYDARFFLPFISLICIVFIVQFSTGNIDITRNIKFFETYLYVYFAILTISFSVDENENDESFNNRVIFRAFIYGVLVSSLVRLLDGSFFQISKFVTEDLSDLGIGSTIYTRFSGLYNDPNYYAVNLILAMCALIFLFSQGDISKYRCIFLVIVFVVFSVMTRSKSALLMLIMPAILLFNATRKRRNVIMYIFLFAALFLIIHFSATGRITWFDSIINRFRTDTDLTSLTTGRTEIWKNYIQYFRNNPMKMMFGTGLSSSILGSRGTHNTYLDIVYYLGLIPGLMYIILIVSLFSIRKTIFKRSLLNYSGIIVVGCMYFFLGCLFDIDVCTNLIIMIVMFNTQI